MLDTSRGRSVTFVMFAPRCSRRRSADTKARSKLISDRRPQGGELAAAISTSIVKELARATGRGPTKARTTLGTDAVFVVLHDTLTRGEQTLADTGGGNAVLDLRRRWRRVMETQMRSEVGSMLPPDDAGEASCGRAVRHVAQEPAEPLIAATSAKGGLVTGRLLPAAHCVPATQEQPGPS